MKTFRVYGSIGTYPSEYQKYEEVDFEITCHEEVVNFIVDNLMGAYDGGLDIEEKTSQQYLQRLAGASPAYCICPSWDKVRRTHCAITYLFCIRRIQISKRRLLRSVYRTVHIAKMSNSLTSQQVEDYIKKALDKEFIKTKEVAGIISIAAQSNKNAIIYGPGGYGKSEMIDFASQLLFPRQYCTEESKELNIKGCLKEHGIEGCSDDDCGKRRVYTMSFGEGMDEADLWGGMDWAKWDTERVLEYHPERSFLNYEFAIFEEIFDAPASVLLSLKDTLTAKELRKGVQRYPMKTRCIIALTNKDPDDIKDLGPSAHALIERFPLQLNLKWGKHSESDYKRLFNKRYPKEHTAIKDRLAGICALTSERGQDISPRIAIHALEACITNADRGDDCFSALRYVDGFQVSIEDMEQELKDMRIRREALDSIVALDMQFDSLVEMLSKAKDIQGAAIIVKGMQHVDAELEKLSLPDDLYEKRSQLRERVYGSLDSARNLMMELAGKVETPDETEF